MYLLWTVISNRLLYFGKCQHPVSSVSLYVFSGFLGVSSVSLLLVFLLGICDNEKVSNNQLCHPCYTVCTATSQTRKVDPSCGRKLMEIRLRRQQEIW